MAHHDWGFLCVLHDTAFVQRESMSTRDLSIVNILIAVVLTLYHILLLGEVFASKLTKRRIFDVTQT